MPAKTCKCQLLPLIHEETKAKAIALTTTIQPQMIFQTKLAASGSTQPSITTIGIWPQAFINQ